MRLNVNYLGNLFARLLQVDQLDAAFDKLQRIDAEPLDGKLMGKAVGKITRRHDRGFAGRRRNGV